MEDLTIIMCTVNRVPAAWAAYHKEKLLEAAAGAAIITISREPLDWGLNLLQEDYGLSNLYRQVWRGAQLAQTLYVATCDDDTLYPPSHFEYRPPADSFGYNLNRWHLFAWESRGRPFYFHKPRPGAGLMIAPRELVVAALGARFVLSEGGELPGRLCHELGQRGSMDCDQARWSKFYTKEPVVSFYHEGSVDEASQRRRKAAWPVRAYDLPYWGPAEELRGRWR
jgi:hypothetical protein